MDDRINTIHININVNHDLNIMNIQVNVPVNA